MNDKNQNHIVEPNKKVSSVEWLFDQINDALIDFTEGKISASLYGIRVTEYKQQAKQMHRDELIDFADNYVDNCVIPNEYMAIPTIMDVPQYYNETFQ